MYTDRPRTWWSTLPRCAGLFLGETPGFLRSSPAFGKLPPKVAKAAVWGGWTASQIPRVGFLHPGFWLPDHGNRDLLRSGDIESNPGPLRGSCAECGGNFTPQSRPLSCGEASCGRQCHRKAVCSGLRSLEAQRQGVWRCGICTGAVGGLLGETLAPPLTGPGGEGGGIGDNLATGGCL